MRYFDEGCKLWGSAEPLHASQSFCSIAGKRLSAKAYLEQWGHKLFPGYFGTFLHPFYTALLPMDADERVAALLAAYPQLLLAMQAPDTSLAEAPPGELRHAGATSWTACSGHWPFAVPPQWALPYTMCISQELVCQQRARCIPSHASAGLQARKRVPKEPHKAVRSGGTTVPPGRARAAGAEQAWWTAPDPVVQAPQGWALSFPLWPVPPYRSAFHKEPFCSMAHLAMLGALHAC